MKILLCAPVHEEAHIFKLYLKHIRKLKKPKNCKIDHLFYFHNCSHLANLLEGEEKALFCENKTDYKKNENTHFWKTENFSDVVKMKNQLLNIARNNYYDYIFYVDSDLILHEETLNDLLRAKVDMISNMFWTQWQPDTPSMPNCWNMDHYQILQSDFLKWQNEKGYHLVGMTGACTLISRELFQHRIISWDPIYNSSISVWEDRAFCMRVAVLGYSIYTSNHNPCAHLYRESEYLKFIESGGKNE